MIYIINKMVVLLRNNLNFFNGITFECFFKEYNRLLFKKNNFTTYNNGKFKSWKRKTN